MERRIVVKLVVASFVGAVLMLVGMQLLAATPANAASATYSVYTVIILFALLLGISNYEQRLEARRKHQRELAESEARLILALWGSGDYFWEYHTSDKQLQCSEFLVNFQYAKYNDKISFRKACSLIHPKDRSKLCQLRQILRGGKREIDVTLRFQRADGEYRWTRWRGKVAVIDAHGNPIRITGTCKDVTFERNAEIELKLTAQVMENTTDAVTIIGTDLKIMKVNKNFEKITGYNANNVMGNHVSILCPPGRRINIEQILTTRLQDSREWEGEEWFKHYSGSKYLSLIRISKLVNENGNVTHYVMMFSDITKKRGFEEKLHYLANYDAMTGLLNRNAFSERLTRAIARANIGNEKLGVLFLDLNNFKQVNDSLGHSVGDALLKATGEKLKRVLRKEDTLARIGGDEFIIVIERVRIRSELAAIAGKILRAFQSPVEVQHNKLTVTPSVGISIFPEDGKIGTELMEHADTAMYQAKKDNQASYTFYNNEMSVIARDNLQLEIRLRQAIECNEFVLHYQPIVDSRSLTTLGVEALIRWIHPELGLRMPSEFIHMAEERGLINKIGNWVLFKACRDIAELNKQLPEPLYVSVNISARQLGEEDFSQKVEGALSITGLGASNLRLELTESLIMEQAALTQYSLERLNNIGVQNSLDDFGTGYSSLSYLKRYPIHHLKIDKSFVQDVNTHEYASSIVTAIIAMAKGMRMGVTAEGVETSAQKEYLDKLGCTEQQGFYYSRPMGYEKLVMQMSDRHVEDLVCVDR